MSRENLGEDASLVAASSLLIDYVLTVAVSVVAGVAAITSAVPALADHAVALSLGFVVLLTAVNLRGRQGVGAGVRDPDLRLRAGDLRDAARRRSRRSRSAPGSPPRARTTRCVRWRDTGGLLTVFLVLRAFASGCTALTGVEAVSNGVPGFQPPKSRNAATTLVLMGLLATTMFAGITALALIAHVHMAEDTVGARRLPRRRGAAHRAEPDRPGHVRPKRDVLRRCRRSRPRSWSWRRTRRSTASPCSSSLLGRDGYLPRQLAHRGDRLVFSNGIVLLAAVAAMLIVAFNAEVTRLIQLYILGVFLSFTLSQAGMVRHWAERLRTGRRRRPSGAACAASRPSTPRAPASTGAGLRDRAADQVRPGRVDRRASRRPILFIGDEGDRAPLPPGERRAARRPRPASRCRRGSTRSCWSRTCSRRRCARWRSPRPRPRPRCVP